MLNCLIIKDNEISTINTKYLSEDNIYKKCGYKSNNNFKKILEHKLNDNIKLELWGKTEGLNKYLNNNKFLLDNKYNIYNKCILIASNNKKEYVSCLKEYYDNMINNNEIVDKVNNKNNDITNNNKEEVLDNNEEIIYDDYQN